MWTTKQRIILEIDMPCAKCRKIAKQIIAAPEGVTSLAIVGRDRAVVVGEGIDAATMVMSLHGKLANKEANILSIEEVKSVDPEKEAKKKKEAEEKRREEEYRNYLAWRGCAYYCYNYPPYPPPPGCGW